MPLEAAENVIELLENKQNAKILILGYSYKAELGDTRETPVKELISRLLQEGFRIETWDPLVLKENIPSNFNIINNPYDCTGIDAVVLATGHSQVIDLDWNKLKNICL